MWSKELFYLAIMTGGIVSLLFIILFYLIIRKAIENNRNNKINQQKEKYREPLLSYILDPTLSRKLRPNTSIKKQAIEELLDRYIDVLEGNQEKQNVYYLAELYLADYYKKILHSRKWSRRFNTLHHIEDFYVRSLLPNIVFLVKNEKVTREEKILALRILALFEYPDLVRELLSNHSNLSEFEYRGIFMKASGKLLDLFILHFQQSPTNMQLALIDSLANNRELRYVSFIESVFQTYRGEIRIRALKALGTIGYVNNIDTYLPLCQSPHWEERVMIARLLGIIQVDEGTNCLEELLQDQSWWVRYQAGLSLKRYPNGIDILKKVFQTSKDPFAQDMAWEWLNKGD
ncbi:HEAT repeat domain-containing protein [Pseudoneobacillus sp. C159]